MLCQDPEEDQEEADLAEAHAEVASAEDTAADLVVHITIITDRTAFGGQDRFLAAGIDARITEAEVVLAACWEC